MTDKPKDGNAFVDEIAADPSMDEYFIRHPSTLKWPDDYERLVRLNRAERARVIAAKEAKK